ncbi:hypothetical protein OHT57_02850 [Streptomyces sp. NBC_00285]|uniref:hypothetical protein n=1 Tax=Streptomyces sp. NBC_00285 TaxID=2975700 RepID=UPI002E2C33C0|nr:hypothetical protein [Streptomyces sp. NBC_00285]
MPENTSTTELTSQYSAQVNADLASNSKEQERLSEEVTLLQEQLAALQRDHQVLVSIQRAIETAPASPETAAPSDSVVAPTARTPRKKAAAKSGADKQTRTKKTSSEADRTSSAKQTAQKPTGKSEAATPTQPTLVELVRRHLADQREPRSAAEITTALGKAHPDRGVKTTVVRTTLEGLVARTQAQRSKQGSSVYYTAPDAPKQAAAPQAEKKADTIDA